MDSRGPLRRGSDSSTPAPRSSSHSFAGNSLHQRRSPLRDSEFVPAWRDQNETRGLLRRDQDVLPPASARRESVGSTSSSNSHLESPTYHIGLPPPQTSMSRSVAEVPLIPAERGGRGRGGSRGRGERGGSGGRGDRGGRGTRGWRGSERKYQQHQYGSR
ncbi:hypothetical protein BC829DRAFT_162279 [Chytridium lagenaria]|nr:hypothetical protein BC829DRAFT_162279 [Chytridium lagenaria]